MFPATIGNWYQSKPKIKMLHLFGVSGVHYKQGRELCLCSCPHYFAVCATARFAVLRAEQQKCRRSLSDGQHYVLESQLEGTLESIKAPRLPRD